jgi:ElaB/YqjD/DUF883 family membrane-anchored ribosome-binding protein
MQHYRSSVIVLAVLGLAGLAEAQDQGVKEVQQLVKRANSTVSAITDTKMQLQKTMAAYDAVLAPDTTDRRGAYKKLQKEMANTEKKRATVAQKSQEMNTQADTVFKSWEGSTADIQNADLRARSQERLTQTKTRFAEIRNSGQQAVELYGPFMKTLQDQVTYLGSDLNASAVASLAPDAAKLKASADELYAAIDKTTAAANSNIAALKP